MSKIVIINDPIDPSLTFIVNILGQLLTEHNQNFWLSRLRYYFNEDTYEAMFVGSRNLLESKNPNKKPDYDLILRITAEEFENSMLRILCKDIRNLTDHYLDCPIYRIELHLNGSQNNIDLQIIEPKDWEKKCMVEKLVKLMYSLIIQSGNDIPTTSEQQKLYEKAWSLVDNCNNHFDDSIYELFINNKIS